MKLGSLATLITLGVAIAAGLDKFSFWWVLIPAFFAGSLALSNGPHFAAVLDANRRGSLTLFPMLLAIYCGGMIALGGAAYGLTRLFT